MSRRPQSCKIRPQTSRLTSCPLYGPGLLLRTLSGRRPSLTRRRRRRPVLTTYPGTYPVQRGGTSTGRRICHATSQNVKGLRFSDDSPLGSPNLLPKTEHLNPSAVRSYRPVPSGGPPPPSSREDVYTDKRSAHNHTSVRFFVYTPLLTHSHLEYSHGSGDNWTTQSPLRFRSCVQTSQFPTHKITTPRPTTPPKAQGADEHDDGEERRERRLARVS